MNRIKIAGLCVLAVFVVSAFAASGAQAGQLGTCVKVSKNAEKKYTGNYTEKLCSTKSATKEGKYEWSPLASAVSFTSEGGASHLKGAAGEISCKHGTDSGTFEAGGVLDKDTFTFEGCELLPFKLACKSYGAKNEGEIVTYELDSAFIDHGEKGLSGGEPAAGEVWEQETNNGDHTDPVFGPGPWLASFECGGVPFAVTGSVSGVVPATYVEKDLKKGKAGKKGKPGKPSFTVEFKEGKGEQDLETTFVNPEHEDMVETGPSIQEGTNEIILTTFPKDLELNSI